jgi:putative peptide zinc metalloprotease protein
LENYDLQVSISELRGRRDQLQAELDSLQRERYRDKQAGGEVPRVQDSLAAVEEQLNDKEADFRHLQLKAPTDGWVIPTPEVAPPPEEDDLQARLPNWSGSPMDAKNLGATLKQGSPFCQIGNPKQMQAALVIDQADIDLVAPGGKAIIKLDELPGDVFYSQIASVSQIPLTAAPRELSHKAGGDLQTKTDSSGNERPESTSYEALAPIDDPNQLLVVGLRGRAKISADRWLSLGTRAWRAFSHTFHFKL